MMIFSTVSMVVNTPPLRILGKLGRGEIHLRATWIFTRVDVLAYMGMLVSGIIVLPTKVRFADQLVGLTIGLYIAKEALKISREAGRK
jgi:Co/Zn/Cd efflux system component